MQGGASRIRTLSDALKDFTPEVRALTQALARTAMSKLGPDALRVVARGVVALETFNSTLGQTNQALTRLAQNPLIARFMGGDDPERELAKLGAGIDTLRATVREATQIVSR